MDILHSNRPADVSGLDAVPLPSTNAQAAQTLVARCPVAAQTPLLQAEAIAVEAGVAEVWVKDERGRMGLGSFKALGAAYVIACDKERGDHRGRTFSHSPSGQHCSVAWLSTEEQLRRESRLRQRGSGCPCGTSGPTSASCRISDYHPLRISGAHTPLSLCFLPTSER